MKYSPQSFPRLGALLACGTLALTTMTAQTTWEFDPPSDLAENYPGQSPLLDVGALLNENVAGQSGYISQRGDQFIRGDGQPIRFWGATVNPMSASSMQRHARFLARRGVNLIRWHHSLIHNETASIDDVPISAVDDVQRMVHYYKQEGIYTKLSYFFILSLRMQARWGIDGYTQAWIDANPDKANDAPFALMFFDDKFKGSLKNCLRVLLTTPNLYDPQKRSLANDPAVAIIELQNEDNLFFWTFDPTRWPIEQQRKSAKAYGDWLKKKYGSLSEAQVQWGSSSPAVSGIDDFGAGLVGLRPAGDMANVNLKSKRILDQIRFLTDLQYNFYKELREYCQKSLGAKCTFTASNWTTANNDYLLDAEHYTYTAAGVIDVHNYFSSQYLAQGVFTQMSGGDWFYQIPAVKNPRRLPAIHKLIEGYPSIVSETSWNNPIDRKGEAALLMAAYNSLADHDGLLWFDTGNPTWESGTRTWQFQNPSILGQFPAATLLYRRGDVATAPAVVREGRTMDAVARKEVNKFRLTTGYDPARPGTGMGSTTSSKQLDSLLGLTGKVEMAFDTDEDYVAPELAMLNDTANKKVRSITGELELDHGNGIFKIDAPRAVGAVGFLNALSANIETSQARIRMRNEFGAVAIIALDGKPLNQSEKVLIQAFTEERYKGWATEPYTINVGSGTTAQTLEAKRIVTVGTYPYVIDEIDASVTLKWNPQVTRVDVLDANGYADPSITATGSSVSGSYRLTLPRRALYTVLTIAKPTDTAPVVLNKTLPNAFVDKAYAAHVGAAGGDGALAFASTGGLPQGFSLANDGVLTGATKAAGTHTVKVRVTDADGDVATADLRLVVLGEAPAEANPFASLVAQTWVSIPTWGWHYGAGNGAGWSLSQAMGGVWVYSVSYPWLYHAKHGFLFASEGAIDTGRWFYSPSLGYLYTGTGVGGWMYQQSTGQWISPQ